MTATPVQVAEDDIQKLTEYLRERPGAVLRTEHLYSRYQTLVRAEGRTPASQLAFSRALGRAGWQRTLIRRGQGPRGKQRYLAASGHVVPGATAVPIEDYRLVTTLRALLGDRDTAMIRSTDIWDEYQRQARQHGWTWTMSQGQVSAWLNRNWLQSMMYGGKRDGGTGPSRPHRYVDRAKLDRISPDSAPSTGHPS